MLLNVVFSFNRAMQLHCFLDSFIRHNKIPNTEIAVVYHTTPPHNESYKVLIERFKNYEYIKFYERGHSRTLFFRIIPRLFKPVNLFHYCKHRYLRRGVDDFKFLVESIIANSACKLLMFSTDDTIYDGTIHIDDNILSKITQSPEQYSFRMHLGKNLISKYDAVVSDEGPNLFWDYYSNLGNGPWGGVFNVDGTIYDKSFILSIMKRLLYHMPATLESYMETYLSGRKMLRYGYCPTESCLTNIWLNRVQQIGYHSSLNMDVLKLSAKYLKGYKIEYQYQKPVSEWGTIPEGVEFIRSVSH
jgi:hypothetical protein